MPRKFRSRAGARTSGAQIQAPTRRTDRDAIRLAAVTTAGAPARSPSPNQGLKLEMGASWMRSRSGVTGLPGVEDDPAQEALAELVPKPGQMAPVPELRRGGCLDLDPDDPAPGPLGHEDPPRAAPALPGGGRARKPVRDFRFGPKLGGDEHLERGTEQVSVPDDRLGGGVQQGGPEAAVRDTTLRPPHEAFEPVRSPGRDFPHHAQPFEMAPVRRAGPSVHAGGRVERFEGVRPSWIPARRHPGSSVAARRRTSVPHPEPRGWRCGPHSFGTTAARRLPPPRTAVPGNLPRRRSGSGRADPALPARPAGVRPPQPAPGAARFGAPVVRQR